MINSLLSRFISDAKSRNVDVYFMLYANNAVNFPIDIFLPHAKKLYTHNINTSDLVAMCDEVIDLQDIFSSDNRNIRETVFDYTKRRLNICSNIMPYQDKYNVLENVMAYRAISPYAEEFEYIDCLMQGTDYIGFQYYTGYYDKRKKEWVSHAPDRCWSVDKVKAFLKLCRNNNIHILLLNRNPYDEQLDAVQLKNVSLPAYFYAISKLKMNVGIDSSAGHIAALLDIPTITLWGRSNPLINHSTEVSFRVLKKNYSIYSRRRNIDYIEPELVLSKILKWQQGELTFEEKIISYKDSLENYMIDIVD